jgi:hypothetical protein
MDNGIPIMSIIEGGRKQEVSPIEHVNGDPYDSGRVQFAR